MAKVVAAAANRMAQAQRTFLQVQSALLFAVLAAIHLLCFLAAAAARVCGVAAETLRATLHPEAAATHRRVREDVAVLAKRPEHLALVLAEGGVPSWTDLANLLTWSIAGGVRVVSIFDGRGMVKSGADTLRRALEKAAFPQMDLTAVRWRDHRHEVVDGRERRRNGFPRDVHEVCLLAEEDAKEDLVRAARGLARAVAGGEMDEAHVDEDAVSRSLSACAGLPDPDVLLLFGPEHSGGGGYPPWQLRLTEMHRLPSLKGLKYGDFLAVLRRFSRCQQRVGK